MLIPYPDLECTRRTAVFTESSLPAGLTKDHRTKADTWVAINVIQGALVLYLADSSTPINVDPSQSAWLEPAVPHRVVCAQPVRFYLAFYRRRTPSTSFARV